MGVQYRDTGWRRIRRGLNELTRYVVRVGVINEQATRIHPLRSRMPVGMVARIQEFGSRQHEIPARSFLRSTVYERETEVRDGLIAVVQSIVSGSSSWAGLFDLGEKFKKYVTEKILSGNVPPPNAPFTVAQKGHDRTLQDTMILSQSIDHETIPRSKADRGGNETL